MTDTTQADEYLQEQLVKQGDVSSMRYIGDDYTRIVTIREDRLLNIINAYIKKRELEAMIDALEYAKISPKYKIEEKIEQLRLELKKYE